MASSPPCCRTLATHAATASTSLVSRTTTESPGAGEDDPSFPHLEVASLSDGRHDLAAEPLVGEGVVEDAHPGALPKLRDALRELRPVVKVDPKTAKRARIPIERMVAINA